MNTFAFLSCLALFGCLVPIWWHIRNRNLACCYLVGWLFLHNLIGLINSLVWPDGNSLQSYDGEILCDVEIKFIVAANAGTCGCIAAIARNLARILSASSSEVFQTKAVRRRRAAIDILLCFGIPIWMMSIHYIVQPSRYYLVSGMGCMPSVDNSWPSTVLLFIWPLVLTLAAIYYSALVIWRMHQHHKEFSAILRNSNSNVTTSRFLRLLLLSCTLIFIYGPINVYIFYLNISVPRLPYSWSEIHDPDVWNIIYRFPANPASEFDRYAPIVGAFLVFFFFGIGTDAMSLYRGVTRSIGIEKYIPKMSKLSFSWRGSRSGGTSGYSNTSSSTTPWTSTTPKLTLAPVSRFYISTFEPELPLPVHHR